MFSNRLCWCFICVVVYHNHETVQSARILGVFPTYGKSHYTAFERLGLELARRGHELVVINTFPQKQKVDNFRDIDVSKYIPSGVNFIDVSFFEKIGTPAGTLYDISDLYGCIELSGMAFDSPEVQDLIRSDGHFDLVIVEMFMTDMFLGFSHKFNAPLIGFTFSTIFPWYNARFANPDNPSYIPCLSSSKGVSMSFMERLSNTFETLLSVLAYRFMYTPLSEKYARKNFGENLPPLESLTQNMSLLLFNSHHSFHGARPLVPNVVEIGGIQIEPANKIPMDLDKFINESEHGVIYFCMGSMLKASTLPDDKREALIDVFSRLPQRVLWKWENETMTGKPDNVKLVKWMPQRDVLAHPNVRLFISHGGLLGTTEAVHSGVPILGMPFYGDQGVNIAAVVANGAGLRLDFKDLNKETLYEALTELLNNPKYRENAKDLSERFRDRPQSPLETAVYWTEYVIRHKGAPHLRSAAVDLTWYQYLLLDVIAFMLLVVIVTLATFYYAVKYVFNLIRRTFTKPQKTKKQKRKNE